MAAKSSVGLLIFASCLAIGMNFFQSMISFPKELQQPCVGSDASQAAKHLTQNNRNNFHFVRLTGSLTTLTQIMRRIL